MQKSSLKISVGMLFLSVIMLWVGVAGAAAAGDINEINDIEDAADWRLHLLLPDGEMRQSAFSAGYGSGEYLLDEPYIPIRLLAEAAGVPIGWYKNDGISAVVWGSSPISLIFAAGQPDVFYVEDARLRHEQHFSAPRLLDGAFCLPLAFLDVLGLEYQLDAAERIITVCVPGFSDHVGSPGAVWQAAQAELSEFYRSAAVLLGSATTYFDDAQIDRSQNIYLAADSLHRQVILPDEVFSFNAAVGRRTPQRGYRRAVMFSDGEAVLGYGGGICQVSSTLYQAALLAGMQIEERHPHSLPVAYAVDGQDATVVWGEQDLRWRNVTGQPIYLLCNIAVASGGALTVEIWQGELPQNVPEILMTD